MANKEIDIHVPKDIVTSRQALENANAENYRRILMLRVNDDKSFRLAVVFYFLAIFIGYGMFY